MASKTDGPIEVRDEHGNPIASTEPRASLLSVEELTEQRIREGHIRFADDTDLGSVQRFIEHLERSAGSEGVHIDAEECAAFARDLRDALAPKMKLYHLLERCVSFFGSDPPRVYVRRFISEIRDVLTETATLRPSEDDR